MKKSMIEVAYQVLTNNDGAMPFVDLWKDVSQEMGFSQTQFEDNIAQFLYRFIFRWPFLEYVTKYLGFTFTSHVFRKCNGYRFYRN